MISTETHDLSKTYYSEANETQQIAFRKWLKDMLHMGPIKVFFVKKDGSLTEDSILEAVLEAGAEEVNDLGEAFEIVSEPVDLVPVRTALQNAGIDYESADSSFLPSMTIPLDADGAKKVFELIDAIEELDDVQNVYSNFDVSDEVMASLD